MVRDSFLRRNADWVGVLEAAYEPAPTDTAWAARVVEALTKAVTCGPTTLISFVFDENRRPHARLTAEGPMTMGPDLVEQAMRIDERIVDVFFFPPTIVSTNTRLAARVSKQARATIAAYRASLGIEDAVGAVVSPSPGESMVIFAGSSRALALPRHEERAFTRIALHIEAAARLRRNPKVVKAILEPSGKVVHLEDRSTTTERLTHHTRAVERSRTRQHRGAMDGLELWTTLVDGRSSLVERVEGSRRYYLVVENAPTRAPMRALTERELDVVSDAARGLSSKMIAYAHGVSTSTVSDRLASAAYKLGLASRVELIRIAAILERPTVNPLPDAKLTTTERDVLALVTAGLTNAEIAAKRNRSIRTIANQVAKLLAKTGSATRRALAART